MSLPAIFAISINYSPLLIPNLQAFSVLGPPILIRGFVSFRKLSYRCLAQKILNELIINLTNNNVNLIYLTDLTIISEMRHLPFGWRIVLSNVFVGSRKRIF